MTTFIIGLDALLDPWNVVLGLAVLMLAPICLGLIPSLIYLGLAMWSMYRAARHRKWSIVAVHLAAAIYSIMEYALLNPVHIPLFAAMAQLDDSE